MAVQKEDTSTGTLSLPDRGMDKVHAREAFKVYVAQLERAAGKYAVGSPVRKAYDDQVEEVKASMDRICK